MKFCSSNIHFLIKSANYERLPLLTKTHEILRELPHLETIFAFLFLFDVWLINYTKIMKNKYELYSFFHCYIHDVVSVTRPHQDLILEAT